MSHKKIFNDWLNHPKLRKNKKLINYSEQEREKFFTYKSFNFGTAGIRKIVGPAPQKLNEFTYRILATGYSKFILGKYTKSAVLIIHDNRKNGKLYAQEAAKALQNHGITVFLAPDDTLLSTPMLSYLIRKKKLSGGINITASHNPIKYNGFKTYNHTGSQTTIEEEKIIKSFFPPLSTALKLKYSKRKPFSTIEQSEIQDYFKEIKGSFPNIPINKDFSILFSSHHGTTSKHTIYLAHLLGFSKFQEFKKECNISSSTNKNEIINPEEKLSFRAILKEAKKQKINYACAQDLDGDRATFAERQKDGTWYFFNGDEIGTIIAHFKLQFFNLKNPYIVSTHVSGTFIDKLFPNIPIYRCATGFKNIANIVNQKEAENSQLLVAFEESCGALIFPFHREKDGYQQIAFILHVIAFQLKKRKTLKNYLDDLKDKYGPWKSFTEIYELPKIDIQKFQEIKPSEIIDYAVQKVHYDKKLKIVSWNFEKDSWVKFRKSGTEDKLKIYFNLFGETEEFIDTQITKLKIFLKEVFKNENKI